MPFAAALPIIAKGAGLLGRLFGGAAKNSADQRSNENTQRLRQAEAAQEYALRRAQLMNSDALGRAQLQSSDAVNRAELDLRRRMFQQQEPNAQARQAAVGSMLNRLQPLSLSGPSDRVRIPTMGNSIINALGPEARQAGALLAQRGLTGLQNGPSQFEALPALNLPPSMSLPEQAPGLNAALQKSGMLEKILGTVGLIGSTVGALGSLGKDDSGPRGSYEPNDENGWG